MVDPPPPAGIQTGLFMAHCVSEFGKPQCDGKFPSPLDIFEASVVQILADVDEYMNPEQPSRPEMKKEHDFMFEIADIREELVMIQEVLGQQHEIMQNYIEDCDNNPRLLYYPQGEESMPKLGAEHWETVKRCKNTIEKYQKRVEKIDGDAQRVEKRIQDQLNLKRTHVSINDARAGLILSTAVIGFTVITIIFAPLAFVTALFALPLDVLLRNQSPLTGTGGSSDTGEGMQPAGAYTTKYVGTWFGE
jgi:Mg2+ and Co2+ transporter CorA